MNYKNLIALLILLITPHAYTQKKITEDDAFALGQQAYIFGYPLVLTDATKDATTQLTPGKSELNRFLYLSEFPDAEFKEVVSPNTDTLYLSAWLDLSKEPVTMQVPDMGNRYYVLQMLDAWTNVFASPGTRTTGSREQKFFITGPGWKGKIPQGMQQIKAPTTLVWIIGRIQCNGPDEVKAVQSLQKKFMLTYPSAPFPAHKKPQNPSGHVAAMPAEQFFSQLAQLMLKNPPAAADAPLMAQLKKIGIIPGKKFDFSTLPQPVIAGLKRAVPAAQQQIAHGLSGMEEKSNGWIMYRSALIGNYGTNYMLRATVALMVLGANLAADAVYPYTNTDSNGQPLTGTYTYRIHFDKGQLPPVNAFWSLTLYNDQHFFVSNPLKRYTIHYYDPLVYNPDGSLDLIISHTEPKTNRANWLPAPTGAFNLIMRLYWPKESVLNGTWQPPAVIRVK